MSEKIQNNVNDEIGEYEDPTFLIYNNTTNGMKTSEWGSLTWDTLFIYILGRYPVTYKDNPKLADKYVSWIKNLPDIMPCGICRQDFQKILENTDELDNISFYKRSRMHMLYYLFLIKEKVNEKLGKVRKETFLQIIEKYNQNRTF